MYLVQEEQFDDVIDELKPMIEDHYFEVEDYLDTIMFNPNYDRYSELAAQGYVNVITARDHTGGLVGYMVTLIMESLHNIGEEFALSDALYVEPEHRHTGCAEQMFRELEKLMKERGVSVMTCSMKVHKPFEALMDFLGYNKVEHVFSKLIKVT